MYKQYIKQAVQMLRENTLVSVISISGTALAIAMVLVMVLVFLASDAAGYMNGCHVEISGGKRCVQNPQFSYQ